MRDLDTLKDAITHFERGVGRLRGLSFEYMMQCMVTAYELALQYAPFKVGSRVTLTKAPSCKDNGWKGAAHFLKPGEPATVSTVEVSPDGMVYGLEFDNETWIDSACVAHKEERKHLYCFREEWVTDLVVPAPAMVGRSDPDYLAEVLCDKCQLTCDKDNNHYRCAARKIVNLEEEVRTCYAEMSKLLPPAIFDSEVWDRVRKYQETHFPCPNS